MKLKFNRFLASSTAGSVAIFFLASQALNAAIVWKAGNDDNLNLTSSWWTTETGTTNPGSIGTSDTLRFGGSGQGASRTLSLGGDLAVGALRLDNSTGTPNYNVTINAGNTLTLNGNNDYSGSYLSGIVLNSGTGGTLTINCNVEVGASQTWVTSRNLTVGGSLTVGTGKTLSFNVAGGTTALNGALIGAGAITKTGGSNFNVLGDGTNFTGSLTNTSSQALAIGLTTAKNASSVSSTGTGYLAVFNAGTTYIKNINVSSTAGFRADYGDAGTKTVVINEGSISSQIVQGSRVIAITKAGTGTLTISSASNTASGAYIVNEGTLKLGSAAALGTTGSGTTVSSGGVLDLNGQAIGAETLTLNGTGISSNGALINSSSTAASYAGLLTLGSSSSIIAGSGNITLSNTGTITGSGYDLTVGGASNTAIAGIIGTDAGSLTKQDGGTLTLSGANTYTGGTTISAGTLALGSAGAVGSSGTISMNGGTLQFSSSNTTDYTSGSRLKIEDGKTATFDTNGQSATFANALALGVSSTGALTKAGSGTLTLSGANTYTGGTTISAGTLALGSAGAVGSTGIISMNGGMLQFSSSNTMDYTSGSRLKIEDGKTATFDTNGQSVTFANALVLGISSTGALTKAGSGTLTLSASNSYTGATTLSAGTLVTGHVSALGTGAVNVTGGTLDLDADLTAASLAGSSSTVDTGGFTLTLNAAANVGTFYTGTFNSSGSLVLRGGGHTVQNNLTGAAGSGSGNFFILQNVGAGTSFHLDTGDSATSRRDFGWTNDSGTALNLSSLQGHGAIRGDAGTPAGGVRQIIVNQSIDTTFDGALLSHTSGGLAIRSLTLTKQGSGKLTLAGFIGEQTASAGIGADVVNLTVESGILNVTNSANGTAGNGTAGTMTVTGGTLAFSSNALGKGGAGSVMMNGGTLRWNTGNTQDLTTSGRLTLVDGKTATLDTNGNDVSFANALGGGVINASLTKTGDGILTLGGGNTYTGDTTVSQGTLVINGSVSTGNLNVGSGATLMGDGTIGGATTIQSGGMLSPGNSPGLLTINSTLTLAGDTLMEIGGSTLGTDYDSVDVSGLLTYGGDLNIVSYNSYNLAQVASYNLFGVGGGETGTFNSVSVGALALVNDAGVWSAEDGGLTYTFTESTGTLVVIPEPGAALLGGIGMLLLLRRRRVG